MKVKTNSEKGLDIGTKICIIVCFELIVVSKLFYTPEKIQGFINDLTCYNIYKRESEIPWFRFN